MDLTRAVYSLTNAFPPDERFGLTQQLRRCAVSVPSNIAEGQGRMSSSDFRHFLAIARGSLMELETQVQLAFELGYCGEVAAADLLALAAETGRILNGLINSLGHAPKRA